MQTPNFLKEKLIKQYGEEIALQIIDGYGQKRIVTLRANLLKTKVEQLEEELTKAQISYQKVPWNTQAFILENITEKQVRDLSIYENGEIYLQSLSSMLPAMILEPKPEENILDMAAAPRRKNFTNGSNL